MSKEVQKHMLVDIDTSEKKKNTEKEKFWQARRFLF